MFYQKEIQTNVANRIVKIYSFSQNSNTDPVKTFWKAPGAKAHTLRWKSSKLFVTFSGIKLTSAVQLLVRRSTESGALTESFLLVLIFTPEEKISHHIELLCFLHVSQTCIDVGHRKMTYLEVLVMWGKIFKNTRKQNSPPGWDSGVAPSLLQSVHRDKDLIKNFHFIWKNTTFLPISYLHLWQRLYLFCFPVTCSVHDVGQGKEGDVSHGARAVVKGMANAF